MFNQNVKVGPKSGKPNHIILLYCFQFQRFPVPSDLSHFQEAPGIKMLGQFVLDISGGGVALIPKVNQVY